jgi:translation initiation factor 2 subunit 2
MEEQELKGILKEMKKSILNEKKHSYSESETKTYIGRLRNVYTKMQDNKVEKQVIVSAPIIEILGNKKSVFVNFFNICDSIRRDPEHVSKFIMSEISSQTTVNSNKQLVMKGYFSSKKIDTVIKKYIDGYVTCFMCNSFDTFIERDKIIRIDFMHCCNCNASRCVKNIDQNYRYFL